jgi:hypothetical protein
MRRKPLKNESIWAVPPAGGGGWKLGTAAVIIPGRRRDVVHFRIKTVKFLVRRTVFKEHTDGCPRCDCR